MKFVNMVINLERRSTMSVDTIKNQIEEENANQENIIKILDLYRTEITGQIKPFVKQKVKNIVESEVKQKAEHTKELGTDKLKVMKQQLMVLVEQSDEVTDTVLGNDDLWLHINYSIDPNGDPWGQKNNNVKKAEKNILSGIKKILGKAGKILIDYGYEKAGSKYDRMSQWQQDDDNEIVYGTNYGFQIPNDLEKKVSDYCSQIEKLHDVIEKKDKLKKELLEQEAVDLWEQV